VRLRARRPDFHNFTLNAQGIAGTCRPGPGYLTAQTNKPVRKWQTAIDEKPHCDCSRVPAAGRESLEDAGLSSAFVEMERLRVELRGERFDLSFFNYISAGRESLADLQIVQIDPCVVLMLLMLFTHHATLTSVYGYLTGIEPLPNVRNGVHIERLVKTLRDVGDMRCCEDVV
jgi:hypothetical protein